MSTVTVEAPTHCAAGHRLGPRQVLVSYRACAHDGGHLCWACRECNHVTYDRPCTNPAQLDGHEYGR